jgi:alcohol dehydrogenase
MMMTQNSKFKILNFRMPTQLSFGAGSRFGLPQACRSLGAAKVLLVTDEGLRRCGIADELSSVLEQEGIATVLFGEVEPDPEIGIVEKCSVAAVGCDLVIGVGGGSSLDIAKLAAIVARRGGSIRDYIGIDQVPGRGLRTVMIPTTAGTGSEVTPIAVLSDKSEQLKKGVVSDHLYADLAVIDPELMLGLPARITAYTGMDALTHAIEAYTNRHAHPYISTFALEGIRLVGSSLRRAVCNGSDLQARSDMALASLYGGMCLGTVNTAAVHALAYPLGGTFDIPHGVANALLLPYVMEFNLISNLEKFRDIAEALGESTLGLPLRQAAQQAVKAVQQLSLDIGIETRLSRLEIPENSIPDMAAAAMRVTRLLDNNPRSLHETDALRIYRNAL